jgi:hypothetical protein
MEELLHNKWTTNHPENRTVNWHQGGLSTREYDIQSHSACIQAGQGVVE